MNGDRQYRVFSGRKEVISSHLVKALLSERRPIVTSVQSITTRMYLALSSYCRDPRLSANLNIQKKLIVQTMSHSQGSHLHFISVRFQCDLSLYVVANGIANPCDLFLPRTMLWAELFKLIFKFDGWTLLNPILYLKFVQERKHCLRVWTLIR